MVGWAIGWQELVIIFGLLGIPGLAGLVLLIVGLSVKKPALWGTGIGLMGLVALILVAGAVLLVAA